MKENQPLFNFKLKGTDYFQPMNVSSIHGSYYLFSTKIHTDIENKIDRIEIMQNYFDGLINFEVDNISFIKIDSNDINFPNRVILIKIQLRAFSKFEGIKVFDIKNEDHKIEILKNDIINLDISEDVLNLDEKDDINKCKNNPEEDQGFGGHCYSLVI